MTVHINSDAGPDYTFHDAGAATQVDFDFATLISPGAMRVRVEHRNMNNTSSARLGWTTTGSAVPAMDPPTTANTDDNRVLMAADAVEIQSVDVPITDFSIHQSADTPYSIMAWN